ncbi:MAG: FAD binding domain-containing protein [Candidatus Humimicrobiaceae bacterium]
MKGIPQCRYLVPNSLVEACRMLDREKHGVVFAGGTDLLVKLYNSIISEVTFISLKTLNFLKKIYCADDKLIIGARATLAAIETDPTIYQLFPVLSCTAANMASPQVRNTATIGGNLCNAAPSADMAPPLLVLDAEVKLTSLSGSRVVPLVDFFKGPEITVMGKGEILEAVLVPLSSSKMNAIYKKCARRNEVDIATVGVAIAGRYLADATFESVKIAYGAVGPVPFRAFELENMLQGKKIKDTVIEEVSNRSGEIISPISNIRSSADYRRTLSCVYTKRLLMGIINKSDIIGEHENG